MYAVDGVKVRGRRESRIERVDGLEMRADTRRANATRPSYDGQAASTHTHTPFESSIIRCNERVRGRG